MGKEGIPVEAGLGPVPEKVVLPETLSSLPEKFETGLFSEDGDANFSKLTNMIVELNFRAGVEVILRRHAIGCLVSLYDSDKGRGKDKLFGDHKFEEIVNLTKISGDTLGGCVKLYETWSRVELLDLIRRGLTTSHFRRITGQATVEDRRKLAEKCITDSGVLTINELNEVGPTSRESKAKAGKTPGRGRPHKRDTTPTREEGDEIPARTIEAEVIDDPLTYIMRLQELGEELKKMLQGLNKQIRSGQSSLGDAQLKEFNSVVNKTAKRLLSVAKAITDRFEGE